MPSLAAISQFVASLSSASICSRAFRTLYAVSLMLREILSELPPRKNLFISPIISGTAYVLKHSPSDTLKLLIALISPTHPAWNTSSQHALPVENLRTIDKTSRILERINFSLAASSPFLIFKRSSCDSAAVIFGKPEVSNPLISTL